jgi:hypothetical protein
MVIDAEDDDVEDPSKLGRATDSLAKLVFNKSLRLSADDGRPTAYPESDVTSFAGTFDAPDETDAFNESGTDLAENNNADCWCAAVTNLGPATAPSSCLCT